MWMVEAPGFLNQPGQKVTILATPNEYFVNGPITITSLRHRMSTSDFDNNGKQAMTKGCSTRKCCRQAASALPRVRVQMCILLQSPDRKEERLWNIR
jgi:hypothetical protein